MSNVKVKFRIEKKKILHVCVIILSPSLAFEPRTHRLFALLLEQTLKQKLETEEHPWEKRLGRRLGFERRQQVSVDFRAPLRCVQLLWVPTGLLRRAGLRQRGS